MNRSERAKEIQAAIAHVLLHDWDPIGIRDEPACVDEYDAYVGGVYRLLVSQATVEEIASHFAKLEHDVIGFPDTKAESLVPVAIKLRTLDVALGSRVDSE